jgi:hypothetical protein
VGGSSGRDRSRGVTGNMHGWPRELGTDALSVSARTIIGSGEAARRLGWGEASVARERQVGDKSPAEPRDKESLLYQRPKPSGHQEVHGTFKFRG